MQATSGLRSILARRQRRWDIPLQGYWGLTVLTVVAYLVLWVTNSHRLYGWQIDDWMVYQKAVKTLHDWKCAFTEGKNCLQPYFYLYSYLPLKSGFRLPSCELPGYGGNTGCFRFFLMYTVFFHGAVALAWAWFAARVAGHRLVAWLSLVIFATCPEFVLWTPQPETRYVGFPLVVLGIAILLAHRSDSPTWRWRCAGMSLLAGSLFGLAQSLHYTALYLIVPAALVLFAREFRQGWRRRGFWSSWIAFGIGCAWLQGLLEVISRGVLKIPMRDGPLMSLVHQVRDHASPLSVAENLAIWRDFAGNLMGWPLLLVAAVGAWWFIRDSAKQAAGPRSDRGALVAMTVLGILLVTVSTSIPFSRKLAMVQPLIYLFAAWAIVETAQRCSPRRAVQAVAGLTLLVAVNLIPWGQSYAIFHGHLGLGEVVRWAHSHSGDREVKWLFRNSRLDFSCPAELEAADKDDWLLTYCPLLAGTTHATLLPVLEAATPVKAAPTIFSTYMHYACRSLSQNTVDMRNNPLINDARVYRIGDLVRPRGSQKSLPVLRISADSVQDPAHEPVNVFDRNESPDGVTTWNADGSRASHFLEIAFKAPTLVEGIDVVMAGFTRTTRIQRLEIGGGLPGKPDQPLWTGDDLEQRQIIHARWEPRALDRLKLAMPRQPLVPGGTNLMIEEILFPGYEVAAPVPQRHFPDLVLRSVEFDGQKVTARGDGIVAGEALLVAGRRIPAQLVWGAGQLQARLSPEQRTLGGQVEVRLVDRYRESNPQMLDLKGGPPVAPRDPTGPEPHGTLSEK